MDLDFFFSSLKQPYLCFKGGKHVFNCCEDLEIFSKFGRFSLKTAFSIPCLISKVSNKSAIGKIYS